MHITRAVDPFVWLCLPVRNCSRKSWEILRIFKKKSQGIPGILRKFFRVSLQNKKNSWEEPFKNGTVMLVSPNKKETAIHECRRLSNMDVRMRKVLVIPLQLRGAVNHCFQMVYLIQLVQFWVFM